MALVDQYGNPIDVGALREPQTSTIRTLDNPFLTPMLGGLTPRRLASILAAADNGDLIQQHRLFSDMVERDPHLAAEMGKRQMAPLQLDWSIQPPRQATAKEAADAQWADDILREGIDDLEDLLLACMDAIGHGFAAIELEWVREDGVFLPRFHPRPQEWFRLSRDRKSIRLRDASPDGAELRPAGWVFHQNGKPKTGYLGRIGLFRVLSWPFLYKSYALGDFAELLESYGLPIIVGKYRSGATAEERASLMRAVTALGHDARAIMPADMVLEIQQAAGGKGGPTHLTMMEWADKSQSKAIIGATLTSQADGKTSTNALGKVHDDVRRDILSADVRQLAGTLTRDVIYPLLLLNRGLSGGPSRCPRFVIDASEPEDMTAYADALPKLSTVMNIPASWAHGKLRIPEAQDGDEILGQRAGGVAGVGGVGGAEGSAAAGPAAPAAAAGKAAKTAAGARAAGGASAVGFGHGAGDGGGDGSGAGDGGGIAALVGAVASSPEIPPPALAARLAIEAEKPWRAILSHVEKLVADAQTLEELQAQLLAAYGDLAIDDLRRVMESGFAVARLAGMAEILDTPQLRGN